MKEPLTVDHFCVPGWLTAISGCQSLGQSVVCPPRGPEKAGVLSCIGQGETAAHCLFCRNRIPGDSGVSGATSCLLWLVMPCLPLLVHRVISRAPGLKLVVETLISSLKPIGNIVLICCAFFIIFGILGVQVRGPQVGRDCTFIPTPFHLCWLTWRPRGPGGASHGPSQRGRRTPA